MIVIVGVLIDGYRRVRSGSRGRLKMSIDKSQKYSENERDDFCNGELPNGGARVVSTTESHSDAAEHHVSAFDVAHEFRPDPLFADDFEPQSTAPSDDVTAHERPEKPTTDPSDSDKILPEAPNVEAAQSSMETADEPPLTVPEPQPQEQKPAFDQVEEVIVMNVFAKDESGFNGADLMRVILACGMRYGDMNIFHREEDGSGGRIQFSMANVVKPGTFNLDEMDVFSTPGVSFFLSLPGPKNSMKALDYMYETAQCVVKNLDGELKDEMHSAMTSQTIEHSRQKIRDFERRQLSLLR